MQELIITTLKTTGIQIIGVFGIFFIFGYILSKLQEWTQKNYINSIGWKGILWTAWIGTPFHELGHAFFAIIFRHKIKKINIFRPDKNTGELGLVDHSYDPGSLYQNIGNFFIGGAPLIFGSAVLVAIVYYLLPGGKEIFAPLTEVNGSIEAIFASTQRTLTKLFTVTNLNSWAFWLFLYISFSISSHLAPSKADRKGMWSGFYWIFLVLLLVNLVMGVLRLNITKYILITGQYIGIFSTIFLYATLISAIHWLLSAIILRPFRR